MGNCMQHPGEGCRHASYDSLQVDPAGCPVQEALVLSACRLRHAAWEMEHCASLLLHAGTG